MTLHNVSFISKDGNDFNSPETAYVGDNKDRAIEQAEEFRHNVKKYEQYAKDYNVCVTDGTGFTLYSQPFVEKDEAEKQEGKRREEWDKEKK